ncbi:class I SAM-dependent methyltransferase [Paenibacillus sp. Soil522]|uniref:class I SAM-dependent methyltransferase n=1 Tax=Paenibacillus sp. Soil522 TaxID=1736388 RepID=UPI0006FFB35A|nr:class I SAM-dependent methyltransferase [Paenibacillus sp. Soil522]KRE39994.1 methyltransferase [Paenibacillus sp. Soil522]
MNDRLDRIRTAEKKYHEACYDDYKLFEEGSWLHKPVKTVMANLSLLENKEELQILDLGCGVGRNSIPIAEVLRNSRGQVVCVDLLESALSKLMSYGEQYGLNNHLLPVLCDIGHYTIPVNEFDYIVAVSSLEHVNSEAVLVDVLDQMRAGTKEQGINCMIINTNIQEMDIQTGESLEPYVEINKCTEAMIELLNNAYKGWEVLDSHVKELEFPISRNEQEILLKSDCLTYVVRNIAKKREL